MELAVFVVVFYEAMTKSCLLENRYQKSIVVQNFVVLGIRPKAIDIDPRCTVDDRRLFSHRRDAPTGRLASLVWME